MIAPAECLFLLVLACGCWLQTVVGFGLGMVVMGANSALGLVPFAVAASVTGVVQLVHGAVALRGHWRSLPRAPCAAALAGMLPAVLAGVWLLHALPGLALPWLQGLLGALIVSGSVQWLLRPAPQAQPSALWGFGAAGAASGLMGGLLSVAGPPIIYHAYRQPWALLQVRHFLIALFFVLYALRSAVDVGLGAWTAPVLWLSMLAAPVSALATAIGRRWRLPVGDAALRRGAALALGALGAYLLLSALAQRLF